jgi:hypothetical protein
MSMKRKEFVSISEVKLPIDGLELLDDELYVLTGGTTSVGGGSGCNCVCVDGGNPGSGAGCDCDCSTTT